MRARIPLGGTFHLFKSNSIGMRSDREYPLQISEKRKRIVLLGDSYTAGDGVSNGERFSDLLEQSHTHLDVMNFGLNGSGTDQQVLIYETFAKSYESDAYIFAILTENIARCGYTCFPSWDWNEHLVVYRPKPYFTLEDDQLVLRNQPVPLERRSIEALGDWKCDFPNVTEYPGDPYAIYRFKNSLLWNLQKRIVDRFLKHVKGKPVFIAPLPMYDHYLEQSPAEYYLERFKELEDISNKVYVIDVLPYLLSLPKQQRLNYRFPNDPHYTALAHRIVSEALLDNVSRFCPGLLTPQGFDSGPV